MWRMGTSTISGKAGPNRTLKYHYGFYRPRNISLLFVPIVCDYMGERLASLFGITSPKYQYAIDEYYRIKKEVWHIRRHTNKVVPVKNRGRKKKTNISCQTDIYICMNPPPPLPAHTGGGGRGGGPLGRGGGASFRGAAKRRAGGSSSRHRGAARSIQSLLRKHQLRYGPRTSCEHHRRQQGALPPPLLKTTSTHFCRWGRSSIL